MGRWIFGSEQLAAAWPRASSRSFLLMSGACFFKSFLAMCSLSLCNFEGKVHLYLDPNGVGERQEITKGAIFGENHFRQASINRIFTEDDSFQVGGRSHDGHCWWGCTMRRAMHYRSALMEALGMNVLLSWGSHSEIPDVGPRFWAVKCWRLEPLTVWIKFRTGSLWRLITAIENSV